MRAWTLPLLLIVACGSEPQPRVEPEPAPEEPSEPEPAAVEPAPEPAPEPEPLEPAEGLVFPPGPHTHEALLEALAHTSSRQFKPVGTTSVVFRMRMRSEHTAAFKPRSRQHRRGYKAEIAAYRIAQLLALDNVPPATLRAVALREIRERFHPRYDDVDTWNEIEEWCLRDPDGRTRGAAIYWIPEMENPRYERAEQIRRWRRWLAHDGTIPEGKDVLARDLSTMLAFDYLIGNWDRFSGGNIHTTPDGTRLFVRDHNAAFAVHLSPQVHTRLRDRLMYSERFSRELVDRIQRMDRDAVERALSLETAHANDPLLNEAQVDGVLERRLTFLSYVGALVDRFGEDAVLFFP
ncbi:MAG: hypothetical protein AAGE52_13990 [Myxococcota bacterium]